MLKKLEKSDSDVIMLEAFIAFILICCLGNKLKDDYFEKDKWQLLSMVVGMVAGMGLWVYLGTHRSDEEKDAPIGNFYFQSISLGILGSLIAMNLRHAIPYVGNKARTLLFGARTDTASSPDLETGLLNADNDESRPTPSP